MVPSSKLEYPPLLSGGLHPMSEDELVELCVERFRLSTSRGAIMEGLKTVLARLRGVGINGEVWIDGSFVTEKIDPLDADFVVRLRGLEFDSASDEVVEAVEWAFSNLKASLRVDGYCWAEWPPDHAEHAFGNERRQYWEKWFGTSRGGQSKGIVVIRLGSGIL